MANTAVTIQISSDDIPSVLVSGVEVEFYSLTGTFITSGMTDPSGQVIVLLPDGTYNVLFYKQGVSILPKQPQQIAVSSLESTNTFLVTSHVRKLPESPDLLRCRISGFLVGQDNLPAQDLHLSFQSIYDISVVGGNLVSPQELMRVQPDDRGYFQFDLIRGMRYKGFLRYIDTLPLLNIDPAQLDIRTPQLPALSLPNLLFPLPTQTTFSLSMISIPLVNGPDSTVNAQTIYSDGSQRTTVPWATLLNDLSDPEIASVVILGGKLIITPMKVGTTTLTYHRQINQNVFWLDAPPYTAATITITVT
jgi:hypothetical protein